MKGGQRSRSLVEFIDLLPTLADLCRIPAPQDLPGVSLKPVLQDPAFEVKNAAFTLITRGSGTGEYGRRIRTKDWAFTQWSDGTTELYDHRTDPEEQRNLASQKPDTVTELARQLETQPPLPAKASRK
jgi:iduronate 2-sulfatase